MNKNELLSLRDSLPADENYIYVHWLMGLRRDNDLFHLIPRDLYFKTYRAVISKILPRSKIRIACLKEDPEVIIGYSVYEPDRIHWIYVKEDWRRIGLAKDLLPEKMSSYSHVTKLALEIIQKKFTKRTMTFNPFF